MAVSVAMACQFSSDGKYFALLSTEGKLQVWNVLSSSFEQEYTPDFHLTTPCTCLHFVQIQSNSNKAHTPKKKVKRKEFNEDVPHVIMGTNSGLLLAYSITKSCLDFKINSDISHPIGCLSWNNENVLFAGAEQYITCWDIKNRRIKNKWKSGNERVASLLIIPNNRLLTASKSIKLWDVKMQQVLQTFIGHSGEVTILEYIFFEKDSNLYFISGSKSDRLLSCWTLNEDGEVRNAVATFLMEDIAYKISIVTGEKFSMNVAAVTRSGVIHVYQHILNGKVSKPLKPKTTIQVASDVGQGNAIVTPIPIVAALYRQNLSVTIGYGSILAYTFENVVINAYEKVQCLVRNNRIMYDKNEHSSKIRTPVTGNHVQYLTPYATSAPLVVPRQKGQQGVSMEKRLDNLTLNKYDNDSKVPKGDNVAQLLVQGLQSKDKNILKDVLSIKDEVVINNTIKRLPMPVIGPLVHELTSFIQGKTLMAHAGSLWLKNLLQVHAGLLLANPELPNLLGPLVCSIESRLELQSPLSKLKGRLDLLISQVNADTVEDEKYEALLVYSDKEANDLEGEELEISGRSDTENDWMEEDSEEEKTQEIRESESEMSVYELSD